MLSGSGTVQRQRGSIGRTTDNKPGNPRAMSQKGNTLDLDLRREHSRESLQSHQWDSAEEQRDDDWPTLPELLGSKAGSEAQLSSCQQGC